MADTMTLEQVHEEMLPHVDGTDTHTKVPVVKMQGWADSIDAAIRERDRLRGDVAGMTEELLHVPSREEWRALQKRAERAEAELAALKARIDGSRHAFLGPNMDRITFLAEDIGPVGKYALVKVED